MKKHKIYSLLACITLVAVAVFSFAGCAGQQNQSDSTQDQQESNDAQETSEPTHISILTSNLCEQAVAELEQSYIAQGHSDVDFDTTTYQDSKDLSSQISSGITADAVVCKSASDMDQLQRNSLINDATYTQCAQDNIVIVAPTSSNITGFTLDDAATGQYRLAIGNESDEIGRDTRQALSTVGGYVYIDGSQGATSSGKGGNFSPALSKEGRVVIDATDKEIIDSLTKGTADVGFMRESDVYRLGGVKIVGHVSPSTHSNVTFSSAIIKDSDQSEAAQDFLMWAAQDTSAQTIWQKWGFDPIG